MDRRQLNSLVEIRLRTSGEYFYKLINSVMHYQAKGGI